MALSKDFQNTDLWYIYDVLFNGGGAGTFDRALFVDSDDISVFKQRTTDPATTYSVFKDDNGLSAFLIYDGVNYISAFRDVQGYGALLDKDQKSVFKDNNGETTLRDGDGVGMFNDVNRSSVFKSAEGKKVLAPIAESLTYQNFSGATIGATIALFDTWKAGAGLGTSIRFTNWLTTGTTFELIIGYV